MPALRRNVSQIYCRACSITVGTPRHLSQRQAVIPPRIFFNQPNMQKSELCCVKGGKRRGKKDSSESTTRLFVAIFGDWKRGLLAGTKCRDQETGCITDGETRVATSTHFYCKVHRRGSWVPELLGFSGCTTAAQVMENVSACARSVIGILTTLPCTG